MAAFSRGNGKSGTKHTIFLLNLKAAGLNSYPCDILMKKNIHGPGNVALNWVSDINVVDKRLGAWLILYLLLHSSHHSSI